MVLSTSCGFSLPPGGQKPMTAASNEIFRLKMLLKYISVERIDKKQWDIMKLLRNIYVTMTVMIASEDVQLNIV